MNFKMRDLKTLISKAKDGYAPEDEYVNRLHADSTALVGHTQPYYPLFYLISKTMMPDFVLELGSWRGYGAAHFAAGCPLTKVATIDIHKDDKLAQQIVLEIEKHYSNMKYFCSWTWDALPLLYEHYNNFKIDVLFIDAWHTYEHVNREWNVFKHCLADEALIIADDLFNAAGACENMLEWWDDFIKQDEIVDTYVDGGLHPGIPMGFARWKRG